MANTDPAWMQLSPDYERARGREDSLDRLVEWPAQRRMIGDVRGRSVLDLGCSSGAKLIELVADGAAPSVGVDIAGNFLSAPEGLELVQADLSDFDALPEVTGRKFDRILFLQSIGYATDPVRTLRATGSTLADDGFIVVTRSHPVRYAVERSEQNGTSLGEEYFSKEEFSHTHSWNPGISLTKGAYTIADTLNLFSDAGLWIEETVEPPMPEDAGDLYPHKRDWMNKHLGILIFKLRPLRAAIGL